jgi:23S rRNA G2069 N7-methylase RlmK/C1962 C5-methylase RlmI
MDKNFLICGDNLTALDDLAKKGINVDLIFLDPPFFSNKHYEAIGEIRLRG